MVYRLWDLFKDVAIWSSDYPHHDAEDAWEALALMNRYEVPAEVQTCSARARAASTASSRC